jgi:hypothetical protein
LVCHTAVRAATVVACSAGEVQRQQESTCGGLQAITFLSRITK